MKCLYPILENYINPILWYLGRNFWSGMVKCTFDKSYMEFIFQKSLIFLPQIGIIEYYG